MDEVTVCAVQCTHSLPSLDVLPIRTAYDHSGFQQPQTRPLLVIPHHCDVRSVPCPMELQYA
jgi:hypothetical protein